MSQGEQQSSASALPPELQAANATKDDRTLAMIGHLLGLVTFLGPLILYLVKKDSASKFALYHIKQSLFYQIALDVILVFLVVGSFIVTVGTVGFGACLCFPIDGLVFLGASVYLVIGAIQVNGGKDFEYYFIGPWVRKSL